MPGGGAGRWLPSLRLRRRSRSRRTSVPVQACRRGAPAAPASPVPAGMCASAGGGFAAGSRAASGDAGRGWRPGRGLAFGLPPSGALRFLQGRRRFFPRQGRACPARQGRRRSRRERRSRALPSGKTSRRRRRNAPSSPRRLVLEVPSPARLGLRPGQGGQAGLLRPPRAFPAGRYLAWRCRASHLLTACSPA